MQAIQEAQFQLKADLIPITVIKLTQADTESMQQQLAATIKKAPNYFSNAPIVIDCSALTQQNTLNIEKIIATLKTEKLIPVAIRGLNNKELEMTATALGLAVLKASPDKEAKSDTEETKKPVNNKSPSKIITSPVRAGSQVYAKGGDLIILSAVNPGAECFADGSIHIYGPLRGRALAGINGDTQAKIFCRTLDAELIAIAGHYQVSEEFCKSDYNQGMIQISLEQNKLQTKFI